MNWIVVDTDVASYLFNSHSSAPRYLSVLRGSELILFFMSVAELRLGASLAQWGPRRRDLIEQFMQEFGIVYPNDQMCALWASLRASIQQKGRHLSSEDAWIAATAVALTAPLATNNQRDYRYVDRLQMLAI